MIDPHPAAEGRPDHYIVGALGVPLVKPLLVNWGVPGSYQVKDGRHPRVEIGAHGLVVAWNQPGTVMRSHSLWSLGPGITWSRHLRRTVLTQPPAIPWREALSERDLRAILTEFVHYYNHDCPQSQPRPAASGSEAAEPARRNYCPICPRRTPPCLSVSGFNRTDFCHPTAFMALIAKAATDRRAPILTVCRSIEG
jgi:hypothetical protein